MTAVIIRRRRLGRTSCNEISRLSGGNIQVVRNWRDQFPADTSFVFRWGCTSNTPPEVPVVNSAAAIHRVSDKSGFRALLKRDAPHTIPDTWFSPDELEYPLREPVIVRRSTHHQGRYLHLCENEAAVRAACGLYNDVYISTYIPKVAEYRVCFVSNKVAWIAKKTPDDPDAVAWNVAQGGRFDNVRWGEWNLDVIRVALEAFSLSGLDFGGVDIMVDAQGRSYVLEINSAPSLTSPYRQTCMAKCFNYILEMGKNPLPIEHGANWRNYIHPSLPGEA